MTNCYCQQNSIGSFTSKYSEKKTKGYLPGSQAILQITLSRLLCLALANLKPMSWKPEVVQCVACLERMVHTIPQKWSSHRCHVKLPEEICCCCCF